MAMVLAAAWLAIQRHKPILRFLQKDGATRRYGDEDVWDFLLSSDDPRPTYVNFRDEQTGQTFSGFVDMFSEEPGNPITWQWRLSDRDLSVNYVTASLKPSAPV